MKRPHMWATPEELGGNLGARPRPRVQFSNGRELGEESVVALRKSGRCFFCEEVSHRAFECPRNPDSIHFGRPY